MDGKMQHRKNILALLNISYDLQEMGQLRVASDIKSIVVDLLNQDFGDNTLEKEVSLRFTRDKKIAGIKWIREQTGWDLKQSKQFFERVYPILQEIQMKPIKDLGGLRSKVKSGGLSPQEALDLLAKCWVPKENKIIPWLKRKNDERK